MNHVGIIVLATVIAFFVGGFAGFKYFESKSAPLHSEFTFPERQQWDNMFDGDFFKHSKDPFQEMARLDKHFKNMFRQTNPLGKFDSWFENSWGDIAAGNIKQKEDGDSVLYELTVGDQQLENLDVIVEGGYVKISADLTKTSKNSTSQTRVQQTLPVPTGVDPTTLEVENNGETVEVRFSKNPTVAING